MTLSASIIGNPSRPYNGNTTATLTGGELLAGWSGDGRDDQHYADSRNVQQQGCGYGRHGDGEPRPAISPLVGHAADQLRVAHHGHRRGHISAVTLSASIIGNPSRPYNGNTNAVLTGSELLAERTW